MNTKQPHFLQNALEGYKFWDRELNLFSLIIDNLRTEDFDAVDVLLRNNQMQISDISRTGHQANSIIESEEMSALYLKYLQWEIVQIEAIETEEELRFRGG